MELHGSLGYIALMLAPDTPADVIYDYCILPDALADVIYDCCILSLRSLMNSLTL